MSKRRKPKDPFDKFLQEEITSSNTKIKSKFSKNIAKKLITDKDQEYIVEKKVRKRPKRKRQFRINLDN
jgi:hypothetical protein